MFFCVVLCCFVFFGDFFCVVWYFRHYFWTPLVFLRRLHQCSLKNIDSGRFLGSFIFSRNFVFLNFGVHQYFFLQQEVEELVAAFEDVYKGSVTKGHDSSLGGQGTYGEITPQDSSHTVNGNQIEY